MKLRLIVSSAVALLVMTAYGQGTITVSPNAAKTRNNVSALGGKASVLFSAKTDDIVITTNINKDPKSPKPVKVGALYQYELLIDVAGGTARRDFTVTKYGKSNFSAKVDRIQLKANQQLFFDVEQVENGIELKRNDDGPMGFAKGKKDEALILFNSTIKLNINFPNVKHTHRTGTTQAGTFLDSLIFNVRQLAEPIALVNRLEGELKGIEDSLTRYAETLDDATYDRLNNRKPSVADALGAAQSKLAELLKLEVSADKSNKLTVDFNEIAALKPTNLLNYNILVLNQVVERALNHEELLEIARKRYAEYPKHYDTPFYGGAVAAYENLLKNCPAELVDTYRGEMNTLLEIRKLTFRMDYCEKNYQKALAEQGFNSDDVWKYLGSEVRYADQLLKAHPEIEGLKERRDELWKVAQKHPKAQKIVTETVTVQSETLSGRISYGGHQQRPFNTLKIYATSSPVIQNGKSHLIGDVKADGTYRVIKPRDMINNLYIYVSGEKDNAHYVPAGQTTLDIVVTTK